MIKFNPLRKKQICIRTELKMMKRLSSWTVFYMSKDLVDSKKLNTGKSNVEVA